MFYLRIYLPASFLSVFFFESLYTINNEQWITFIINYYNLVVKIVPVHCGFLDWFLFLHPVEDPKKLYLRAKSVMYKVSSNYLSQIYWEKIWMVGLYTEWLIFFCCLCHSKTYCDSLTFLYQFTDQPCILTFMLLSHPVGITALTYYCKCYFLYKIVVELVWTHESAASLIIIR